MNAPVIDLLSQAIAKVKPHLDRSRPVAYRLRALWGGAKAARKFGTADVIAEEFKELARASGLVADLGRHGAEDVEHVIRWGLFGRDPFGGMS